ncbi:hypothetical protein NMY22_g1459 [Coprinellus aureogranulatus]|nr:hypothetical protein NMY22_g1459 [Coprinellus aureogranulatus]
MQSVYHSIARDWTTVPCTGVRKVGKDRRRASGRPTIHTPPGINKGVADLPARGCRQQGGWSITLSVADTLFEGLGFLHEKRIARRGKPGIGISKVIVSRLKAARSGYMGLKLGPCNPFLDDVRALGYTLQRSIRHVEDKIPEIGAFFDRVVGGIRQAQRPHRIAGVSRLARSTPSSGSLPTRVRADGTVLGAK